MATATIALLRHGGSHLIRPVVAGLQEIAKGRSLDDVLRLMTTDVLIGDIIEPGNFGAPIDEAQGPVIVFLRDPRDRMAATWRWWREKPRKAAMMTQGGETVDAQIAWLLAEGEFLPEMMRWARIWCRWPGALTVRFEDMRADGCAEIARIATHLGLSDDADRDAAIFAEVYGHGRTFTGRHSDWRDTFGPKAKQVWALNGGPDLMWMMGYT